MARKIHLTFCAQSTLSAIQERDISQTFYKGFFTLVLHHPGLLTGFVGGVESADYSVSVRNKSVKQ